MSREQVGGYEVIRRLGAGGMGEVLLARDPKLERLVAIKVLRSDFAVDPVARKRFHREARALASLRHPGVVTIYEIGEDEGLDFIVMEFLEGVNLRAFMTRNTLDQERIVDLAKQIADAIAGAHGAGVLHRDIKPENIMVLDDGTIRVVDFGLARGFDDVEGVGARSADAAIHLMGDTVDVSQLETIEQGSTPPGGGSRGASLNRDQLTANTETILGTPVYMAPELFAGGRPTAASDLYSFGVLLYEMFSGSLPFAAENLKGLLKVLVYEYSPPPRLDEQGFATTEVASLVAELLSSVSDERPDVHDVLKQLEELSGPTTETVQPLAAALRPTAMTLSQEIEPLVARRRRQRRGALGAVSVAVLLAAGVFYLRSTPSSETGDKPTPAVQVSNLDENSIRIAIKPFAGNVKSYAHSNGRVGGSAATVMASLLNRAEPIWAIPPATLQGHIGNQHLKTEDWLRAGHEVGALYLVDTKWRDEDGSFVADVAITNLLDRSVTQLGVVEASVEKLDTMLFDIASKIAEATVPGLQLAASTSDAQRSVDSLALYDEALRNLYENKWVPATVLLEQIVAEQPAFFEAWYHLAVARAWAARPREKSLNAARKALSLASTKRDRGLMEAIIAYIERDFLRVVPLAEALAKRYPRDPEIAYLYAEVTYHNGRYKDALKLFDVAIRLAPRSNLASTHPIQHAEVNGNLERWQHYHALRADHTIDDMKALGRDKKLRYALGEFDTLLEESKPGELGRIKVLSTMQRDKELDEELASLPTLAREVLEHAMARAWEVGDRERARELFDTGYATIRNGAATPGNRFRMLTFPEVLIVGEMKDELREFLSYWSLEGPEQHGAQEAEFRAFSAVPLGDRSLVRGKGYGSWREQQRATAILAELDGDLAGAAAIWKALLDDPSQWGDLLDRVAYARTLHGLGRSKELRRVCSELVRPKDWRPAYSVARMKCREWNALPDKRDAMGAFLRVR